MDRLFYITQRKVMSKHSNSDLLNSDSQHRGLRSGIERGMCFFVFLLGFKAHSFSNRYALPACFMHVFLNVYFLSFKINLTNLVFEI